MADRKNEIGTVHRVEVEIAHAMINEIHDLFGSDRGGDELASRDIVVEPFKSSRKPARDRGAAARRKTLRLLEILNRQDARNDWEGNPAGTNAVEKAEVDVVFKEEL